MMPKVKIRGRETRGGSSQITYKFKKPLHVEDLFDCVEDQKWQPLKYTLGVFGVQDGYKDIPDYYLEHRIFIKFEPGILLGVKGRIDESSEDGCAVTGQTTVILPSGELLVSFCSSKISMEEKGAKLVRCQYKDDLGEAIDLLELISFTVLAPSMHDRAVMKNCESVGEVICELVVLDEKFGWSGGGHSFYRAKSMPDQGLLEAGKPRAEGAELIQLRDEGYPFVGPWLDEDSGEIVLSWYNNDTRVAPVRIRTLEDVNIRLVIPSLLFANFREEYTWYGNWVGRFLSTEWGYNEDKNWWSVMHGHQPYKIKVDRQAWWGTEPTVVSARAPVIWYNHKPPARRNHHFVHSALLERIPDALVTIGY